MKYVFRGNQSDTETHPIEVSIIEEVLPTETLVQADTLTPTFFSRQNQQPDWLINEDILRDEGVIFGLSGSNPEEKVSIIRHYFTQETAETDKAIAQQQEEIGELNYWINEKESLVKEIELKIQTLKNQEFTEHHHLLRTIIGLLLATGIAVGNYFLIKESLQGQFQESTFIALGVFLAGMFNLFGRISFLHDEEKTSTWKRLLEEVGMPLAAAFFVFAQIYTSKPPLQAWALLAFIFFLFMFSGKLLLGNLTVFKDDFSVFQKRNQLYKDKIKKVEEWETQIENLKGEIEKFRIKKQDILPKLTKLSTQNMKLKAQRDMLIKVFESEYHLALNYKNRLNNNQMKTILGEEE
jgi:TolA-binding protein